VNGPDEHPIYTWLKSQPGGAGDLSWNFEKFLVGRDGELIDRWSTQVEADDPFITSAIETALQQ
jgi:glutathione peroxidase